ncbi:MAG: Shikimate kinase 2 [Phycisphaerae bacterium]|nr:Shikimate kinase 2 [Phycisphaerae bacterium]
MSDPRKKLIKPAPGDPRGPGWVLIGYRGSGKTTVGRALAERIEAPFVDTDEQIMRRAGRSIREIFADSGEPAFRELERATIAELDACPAKVVAVGGGAIEDRRNVARLRELGRIIWLDARPDILAARIAADPQTRNARPPLTGLSLADEAATVLRRRRPLYAEACDLRVDATSDNPSVIAEVILEAFPPASV